MPEKTYQDTAIQQLRYAPEIITSSEALAISDFRLDRALTSKVLQKFACEAAGDTEIHDLSSHVIIGIPGTYPTKAASVKVNDRIYHTLPVIPITTSNPDLIDWSKPLQKTSQEGFNYRAVRYLANIASYGNVQAPPKPDEQPHEDQTHNRSRQQFGYNFLYAATYAGAAAISELFRRREARRSREQKQQQMHRRNRLIEETAVAHKVIREYKH